MRNSCPCGIVFLIILCNFLPLKKNILIQKEKTMKKTYMIPALEVVCIQSQPLLTGSGVNTDGIGYGGVDTDGTMEPSSRVLLDLLDI